MFAYTKSAIQMLGRIVPIIYSRKDDRLCHKDCILKILQNKLRIKTRTVVYRNIIDDSFFPDSFKKLVFASAKLTVVSFFDASRIPGFRNAIKINNLLFAIHIFGLQFLW